MANPSFVSSLKIPMTPKPITSSIGANRPTYDDIFNIQNTIRIMFKMFVEEAPADGNIYGRQNGRWVDISSSAGGGRFPLVTGETPPVLVYLDDGNLVYTP